MKMTLLSISFGVLSLLVVYQLDGVESQSLMSPFAFVCRNTCGGYGLFRRMCCYMDPLCCEKPGECPEDPTQDTMVPMCQSCNEDVDCMWTSKCCQHESKKCCTPLRSSFFSKNSSKRAKEKIGVVSKVSSNNSTKSSTEKAAEEEESHVHAH